MREILHTFHRLSRNQGAVGVKVRRTVVDIHLSNGVSVPIADIGSAITNATNKYFRICILSSPNINLTAY